MPDLKHPVGKIAFALPLCLAEFNNTQINTVRGVRGDAFVHSAWLLPRHVAAQHTVAVTPRDLHKILWQHTAMQLNFGAGHTMAFDFEGMQRVLLDDFVRQARRIDVRELVNSRNPRLMSFELCNAGLLQAVAAKYPQVIISN